MGNNNEKKFVLGFEEFKILELAKSKKEHAEKMGEYTDIIHEHLLKLYLLPYSDDTTHWKIEILGWLEKIDRKRWNKGKKFKVEIYYKTLYTDYKEKKNKQDYYVKQIISEYQNHYIVPFDESDYDRKCSEFFKNVCYQIANDLFVKGDNLIFDIFVKK